jgi:hypothetical protein
MCPACASTYLPIAHENGDLLAPRRQERQVRSHFFLCGLCVFARYIPTFGCGAAFIKRFIGAMPPVVVAFLFGIDARTTSNE